MNRPKKAIMKSLLILLTIITSQFFSSTSFSQEKDGIHHGAEETFKYWAGEEPWEGIEVFNGQYWASDHFTKEYILYMELKVPVEMAKHFISDNNLQITDDELEIPDDAPQWFNPPKGFKKYRAGSQGSKYFINPETGYMFMYEVQL